ELQAPGVGGAVDAVAARGAGRGLQQALALVEADGVDIDPGGLGQAADGEAGGGSHAGSLNPGVESGLKARRPPAGHRPAEPPARVCAGTRSDRSAPLRRSATRQALTPGSACERNTTSSPPMV